MCNYFDKVIYTMQLASIVKVQKCLKNVEWNQAAVSKALTDTDWNVNSICACSNGGKLEFVTFYCTVPFEANEIPGVVSPFFCCMYVEASFDEKTEKYRVGGGFGPMGIANSADGKSFYDTDYLYNEFCKEGSRLTISQFVSNDFDFRKVCDDLNCGKYVCLDTGKVLHSKNKERSKK